MAYSDILLWDLSRYNSRADGSADVDFNKAVSEGIQAGFYRGTIGTAGIDHKFYTYAQKSDAVGLPWGPYHAFRPLDNPVKQGEALADLLFSGVGRTRIGQLPPVFDIEVSADLPPKRLESDILRMLQGYDDTVRKLNRGISIKPIIYTSAGFWNGNVGLTTWAKDYLLFVAHWFYTGKQTVEEWNLKYKNPKPIVPGDWSDRRETFWQFSANGNQQGARYGTTGDADLDLSWFNGTREDFKNLFGVYPRAVAAPPPQSPSDAFPGAYIVDQKKCKAVNFRSSPKTATETLRGVLAAGEPVYPTGKIDGYWMEVVLPQKYWISSFYLKKK